MMPLSAVLKQSIEGLSDPETTSIGKRATGELGGKDRLDQQANGLGNQAVANGGDFQSATSAGEFGNVNASMREKAVGAGSKLSKDRGDFVGELGGEFVEGVAVDAGGGTTASGNGPGPLQQIGIAKVVVKNAVAHRKCREGIRKRTRINRGRGFHRKMGSRRMVGAEGR